MSKSLNNPSEEPKKVALKKGAVRPRNEDPIYAIARDEIKRWSGMTPGVPMAILFAFCHRLTTGKTIEQSFFGGDKPPRNVPDYQI